MYDETLIETTPSDPGDTSRSYAATVHNTPAADGDDVYVTIPGVDDEETKWGPCRYMKRGTALPTAGDDALVQFDDESNIWIIAWWPYA